MAYIKKSTVDKKVKREVDFKKSEKKNQIRKSASGKLTQNDNRRVNMAETARPEQKPRIRIEKSLKSICKFSGKCGGCQLIDMPYEEQLKQKFTNTKELLSGICVPEKIEAMENPFHYRNKVHSVFDHDRRGTVLRGIYKEDSHEVVPVSGCLLEDERADKIIETVKELLPSFKIKIYDEDTEYGLFRHVLVRTAEEGEILVVLVTSSVIFPSKNNFVKALIKKHPEITTIIQNINEKQTSMVLGDREQVMYGKGYITDTLCGKHFRISAKSFYQVNHYMTEKLYAMVKEMAALTGEETVIDAYCGIGTIGMVISDKAKKVIGVEQNSDAVRNARFNTKLNKINNMEIYCADATEFMSKLAETGEKVDVICLDPPRSGSTKEFIDAVDILKTQKVIYISCNPETLARDLLLFKGKGYTIRRTILYDMFPETPHVETVCLLSRIN